MENEALEQQTNGQHFNLERFFDSTDQNQVIEKNFDDKIGKAVDDAVSAVENCMHDRVEMDVKSITCSSRHGPNCEVQNPDRSHLFWYTGNTPLMSTPSRLDLNKNQDRKGEIRNEEHFEDGNFPVLGPNYDRRAQAHHNRFVTQRSLQNCISWRYQCFQLARVFDNQ